MKIVLFLDEQQTVVTFDKKTENPWLILSQLSEQIPDLLDKPVKFSRRIPKSDKSWYICWEAGNSTPECGQTYEHAVQFIRPKRSLRTLGELLQKYATSK